jgi:hypothetical protein
MRLRLTAIIFFTSVSFIFGQSKWEMIGQYKHSLFMYSYKLTLTDDENYEIEESSDFGSEMIVGTWTMVGRRIWLMPKKQISIDVQKNRTEKEIIEPKVVVVEIETENVLAPKNRSFKLLRSRVSDR